MADGIGNVFLIPGIALSLVDFFLFGPLRLVIAVSHIDTFLIVDEIHLRVRKLVLARFLILVQVAVEFAVVAEVEPCGILLEIAVISGDKSARRIDGAVQHAAERHDSVFTRRAHPQRSFDVVEYSRFVLEIIGIIEEAEFELCCAVEDDYDVIEIVACLFEHVDFVSVELEIVVVLAACAGYYSGVVGMRGFSAETSAARAVGILP